MHPGHGAVRLARTSVFAATALALSIGAHQLAGGCLPSLGAILVAAGPVGLGAALLTTRRCRFGVLVVALGALQAGLHVFFHLTGSPATASTRPMAAHPGAFTSGATHHGLHLGVSSLAPGGSIAPIPAPDLGITPLMLAAHLVATIVCAVLMAHAEGWLWRLVERWRGWCFALAGRAPAPRRPLWQVHHRHAPVGLGRRITPGRILRGPPVEFAS